MTFVLALTLGFAQPLVTSAATADRTDVRLSDSVRVTLTVEGAAPLRVELPKELLDPPSLEAWRLRPVGAAAVTDLPGGRQRWTQTFRADPYRPGMLTLGFAPAKAFAGQAPAPVTVDWRPFPQVTVSSPVQDTDEARPVTGIEHLPHPPSATDPRRLTGAILAGLLAAALGAAVVVWVVRRRKPVPLTPVEWATRELDALDGAEGDDFAERLSGVLRTYLERRSGLPATRRTTAELLAAAAEGFPGEAVRPILERCDAAKFAGQALTADECRELLAEARAVVEATSRTASDPAGNPAPPSASASPT
jgi:hypothetical protein